MVQSGNRIVVCGSGLSGLTAAVSALEIGASVDLIEKAPEIGGTTVLSGGLIWTFRDYEQIRHDIPAGDAALQWLVHDSVSDARTWLEGLGAKLGPEESLLGHGFGRIMDPPQAIATLASRFESLGGRLHLGTALHSLIVEKGVVLGVHALRDGVPVDFTGSVVLATGGFQGNPELLTRYVLPDPSNLILRANPWSTGDAFLAATQIGAAVSAGLNTFYGHALTAAPARYSKLEFRDVSQYYGQASVALNLDGERFADESEGTGEEVLNQHLARQRNGCGFYVIDRRLLESFPIQGLEVAIGTMIDRARHARAPIVEAQTLEELCTGLVPFSVPEAKALRTLRDFNAAIEAGRADELRPARRGRRTPLTQAPFYAVGIQAAITFTMGGLAVDDNCRVLWRSGTSSPLVNPPITRAFMEPAAGLVAIGSDYRQSPIRGLYAAGCDTGNISHTNYMGGLAAALTTGRTAGRAAASYQTN
jgi:succinate dehydrogenase/fumarate reductase flavoprotein subunit